MEIEFELNLTLSTELCQYVRDHANDKLELATFRGPGKFGLRPSGLLFDGLTVDKAIQTFLEAIESVGDALSGCDGLLRVGVYIEEGEAVAFSVDLSSTTVKWLARYQFAIEVNCYPCSSQCDR
jgi:hypothetical protein